MTRRARLALFLVVAVAACGSSVAVAAFGDTTSNAANSWAAAAQFPPQVDSVPDVFGVGQAGQTVQASTGAFHPPSAFAYQWLRCDGAGANCVAISGATTSSRALAAADATLRIRVRVTPTNGSTAGAAVFSEPTDTVRTSGQGPTITAPTGATGTTYTVVVADKGRRLRGRVAGSSGVLLPNTASTADTALVP